jgi:chromatin remodeling complex protein RSC6
MVKTTKTTTPKTASKTASKTDKVVEAAAPVVEAAPVEAAAPIVETTTVVEEPISTVFGQFTDFMAKLQAVSASMSSIRTEFRGIERQVTRELKAAAKLQAKRKRKTGNRAPSGFVKPTLISNELAGFLGKPEGTEMARTQVTREINAYIREHKLQDKDNGRKIIADKKLTSLLKLKKDDLLTYFNLQKYMSPHFAKASDKIAAATAAATTAATTAV